MWKAMAMNDLWEELDKSDDYIGTTVRLYGVLEKKSFWIDWSS